MTGERACVACGAAPAHTPDPYRCCSLPAAEHGAIARRVVASTTRLSVRARHEKLFAIIFQSELLFTLSCRRRRVAPAAAATTRHEIAPRDTRGPLSFSQSPKSRYTAHSSRHTPPPTAQHTNRMVGASRPRPVTELTLPQASAARCPQSALRSISASPHARRPTRLPR